MAIENSSNQSDSISPAEVVEPIRSHYEPGEVTMLCDEWIAKTKARLDAIVALPESQQPNALFEFEEAMSDFGDAVGQLMITGSLYPDAKISAEGSACEEKVGHFSVEVHTRKDIYQIIKKFPPTGEVERRLYEETVKGFELNGLNLPDDKLAQVRELKQKLSALEVKFGTNLNLDKSTIAFTKEELDGAPERFLGRLEKTADGKFIVTMKYPDLEAVMLNAKSGETRKRMRFAFKTAACRKKIRGFWKRRCCFASRLRASAAMLRGWTTVLQCAWQRTRPTSRLSSQTSSPQ